MPLPNSIDFLTLLDSGWGALGDKGGFGAEKSLTGELLSFERDFLASELRVFSGLFSFFFYHQLAPVT